MVTCHADKEAWRAYKEYWDMTAPRMKKPTHSGHPPATETPWKDSDFEGDYPFLYAFLCESKWDDGTARETGTLTLFTNDGVLKAVLNDRAFNRSAFTSAPTLSGLFDQMESALEQDCVEWRGRKK